MPREQRFTEQWILCNIYFKAFSDVWLDSGQKASLKISCFVFPHKLLTSEQWYEHKSQYVTSAFNLQDSHVWSHRLRLQLQSKAVKEERFMLSLAALWWRTHTRICVYQQKTGQKSLSPFLLCVFTYGFCLWFSGACNTTLCCVEINYAKSWFLISSLVVE